MGSPFQSNPQQQQVQPQGFPPAMNPTMQPQPPSYQNQGFNIGGSEQMMAKGVPDRPLGFPTAGANSPIPYGSFRGVSPYSPVRNY